MVGKMILISLIMIVVFWNVDKFVLGGSLSRAVIKNEGAAFWIIGIWHVLTILSIPVYAVYFVMKF